ncbi:Imidazoleglycerol-phosphate dehydratase [Candidatus Methanobinarius endosymbioticus]|uniref:Imidazoleglycerol-phosphate dehydratase n=1 Tax=Candidatus Methanobinarius endosymbioticus TaxID=2006182 RepID=A0A366MDR6_9EURY|nr:Imidazoleglycerol-phosphate dehydratase [Candidatus Methanobinarius endosymbioticus]
MEKIRTAKVSRKTSETDIKILIDLNGNGIYNINTGINFFNHMLESFSKHSLIDLDIEAVSDIDIDDHHTVEDIGILLGEAFLEAIGKKVGIRRMSHAIVPMDDSLATLAIDMSGRGYLRADFSFNNDKIGDMTSDTIIHFFESFTSSGKVNLNISAEGSNDHHKAEAIFKAFAKALKDACEIEHDSIPSTKGII